MKTTLSDIQQWLVERGEKAYRFQQIEHAWYQKKDWSGVQVLPKALREEATQRFPWMSLAESKIFVSPSDGTEKALLKLSDEQLIETVLMPNARDKWTVCISSQVGCGMGCTFCATGTMGFKRDLSVDEIVDQVRFWKFRNPAQTISNIVFMGMGEPLANYDAVVAAAKIFNEEMQIGITRITISTVGFRPGLKRILEDKNFPRVRIAFSLHAGTDAVRSKIVPSHRGFSMKDIVAWAKKYVEHSGNRRHYLTLEYVMLWGVNDDPSESAALAKLFSPIKHRVKLNLIPWNPTTAPLKASSEDRLNAFQKITEAAGIPTTIRYSKGLDIAAACGQLVTSQKTAIGTDP